MFKRLVNYYGRVFGFIDDDKLEEAPIKTLEEDSDLDIAVASLNWFFAGKQVSVIEEAASIEIDSLKDTFPKLFELISKARIEKIRIDSSIYTSLTWDTKDETKCGWICTGGENSNQLEIIKAHKLLSDCIGGVKETWTEYGEIEQTNCFTLNQNFLFIPNFCYQGIGANEAVYLSTCSTESLTPIKGFQNFVVFAKEANGNLTLYNPNDSRVYLFAHDHDFNYVEKVEGQPEMSFYRIVGCENFVDYVERIAMNWLSIIK